MTDDDTDDASAVIRRFPAERRGPATIEHLRSIQLDRTVIVQGLRYLRYSLPGTAGAVAQEGRIKARTLLRDYDVDATAEQIAVDLTEWLRAPIEQAVTRTSAVRDRLFDLDREYQTILADEAAAVERDDNPRVWWERRWGPVVLEAGQVWSDNQVLFGAWEVILDVIDAYRRGIRPRKRRRAPSLPVSGGKAANIVPFPMPFRPVLRHPDAGADTP